MGGLSYFLMPQKYLAIGSLFIGRQIEKSDGKYFTYEGYYSQQTAQNYTNTVIGFLESAELKKDALESVGLPVTEESLRKLGNQIKTKKTSPQLITITIKSEDPERANYYWSYFSGKTIETAKELNKTGDESLQIEPMGQPVVKEQYRNIILNLFAGMCLGSLVGSFSVVLATYFKETK